MAGCEPYTPGEVMALLDWFMATRREMYAALVALGVGSGAIRWCGAWWKSARSGSRDNDRGAD